MLFSNGWIPLKSTELPFNIAGWLTVLFICKHLYRCVYVFNEVIESTNYQDLISIMSLRE